MSLPEPYYDHAGITIFHADCRDILPHISADVVVTDPPYGVDGAQKTKAAQRRGGWKKNDYTMFHDSVAYVRSVVAPFIEDCLLQIGRMVITPGNRCVTLYPIPDSFGAIFQPASVGLQPWGRADAQPILYYGRCPRGGKQLPSQRCSFTYSEAPPKAAAGHPCPKPSALWAKIVAAASLPGETVLDPFMGSGTTLRAAKDLGRKAIGIEIEEHYCEIAAKRLAQEVLPFTP